MRTRDEIDLLDPDVFDNPDHLDREEGEAALGLDWRRSDARLGLEDADD
ncbi:hypothetical protein [Brevundimonas sp. Leaf363]|nr:hypothetical protein [Brevundimonas sp. Leaf363]